MSTSSLYAPGTGTAAEPPSGVTQFSPMSNWICQMLRPSGVTGVPAALPPVKLAQGIRIWFQVSVTVNEELG